MTQARGREPDIETQLFAQVLGLLIEHQEDRDRLAALVTAYLDVVDDVVVLEQVVVDVLNRGELLVGGLPWHEDVGVAPVKTVDVADGLEVIDPLVHAEQIEVRCTDVVDGTLIAAEEAAHVRDAGDGFHVALQSRPHGHLGHWCGRSSAVRFSHAPASDVDTAPAVREHKRHTAVRPFPQHSSRTPLCAFSVDCRQGTALPHDHLRGNGARSHKDDRTG
jgi:hypothetical protein